MENVGLGGKNNLAKTLTFDDIFFPPKPNTKFSVKSGLLKRIQL
jgi:hypothetical protein